MSPDVSELGSYRNERTGEVRKVVRVVTIFRTRALDPANNLKKTVIWRTDDKESIPLKPAQVGDETRLVTRDHRGDVWVRD